MKVAIIGGGAAGMMTAVTAAEKGAEVVLFERGARLGRKLAVTGNGRCNLTNTELTPDNYHGERADFAAPALAAFGVSDTIAFFRSIGLVTVRENSGRVYPHSDQAGSVVDVLRFATENAKVEVKTSTEVKNISKVGNVFEITSENEQTVCDRVIVTCGGLAGTKAGGSPLGYDLLRSLGHTCTKLSPSLVQLKTENAFTRPLKGVRADAKVEITVGGKVIASSVGEVQFTDYGVSGPAVFEVSRAAVTAENAVVRLDLMRELSKEELVDIMQKRSGFSTVENLLTGTLHNKLGRTVLTTLGYSLTTPVSSLHNYDFERIAAAVKKTELKVTGSMGMDGAQVTAGGISTEEFDPVTMESRLVPGLYAAGEVLDIDGDCGGYNLQWAWSSGRAAGLAAAEE